MPYTTMRVLTMLELLQARRQLSGPELAERLEINVRTVRRYMTALQDLGFPVETVRGRYGAYRLRPGYKLPPLMFTDDEALAVVLGLLAARRLGLGMETPAIEGAQTKIARVLPVALRERVRAVQESVVVAAYTQPDVPATASILVTLGAATQARRRVGMRYRDFEDRETERSFDPYGLVYRAGRWYAAGYCHLRSAVRVFRLDRVVEVIEHEESFEPPTDFDALAEVERGIAQTPYGWVAKVKLHTSLEQAQCCVPATLGTIEAIPEGVLLRATGDHPDWIAANLARLMCEFTVLSPPEVCESLRRLAARLNAACEAQ